MWFFWWNGQSGGARFFWWMFFLFMFINVVPFLFRSGFFSFLLFMFLGFIVMNALRRNNDRSVNTPPTQRAYTPEPRRVVIPNRPPLNDPPVVVHEDTLHDHALRAARAVGIDPNTAHIAPIDIGVIAYHHDDMVVHRLWQIDAKAEALQPFVNLRVKRAARGMLRFEIRDADDELVFFYERDYNLSLGANLIMPPARMPIDQSADKSRPWTLRVLGDGLPIAEHRLVWLIGDTQDLGAHIGEDGEISDELRMMMARARLDRMSLDDLLGDDADDAKKRRR